MSDKTAHQLLGADGKPVVPATSAPGWFVHDGEDLQVQDFQQVQPGNAEVRWGPLFATPQPGNEVEFFVTGDEYFKKVAAAISGARRSVFIAGWQVNYDVELSGTRTLFHCLQDALKGGARVYVMPWLSPKAGVDTGDFETMLAVYQLNAGLPSPRAFCLPSMQQGDQGSLSIFFSHHQKLVVVDNDVAYWGGIDLAYGRRDDGNFSLRPVGRALNELYNPCVPAIHALSHAEQGQTLTRAELLAAALTDGWKQGVATFATSNPSGIVAKTYDVLGAGKELAGNAATRVSDWVNDTLTIDFIEQLRNHAQDYTADQAQTATNWAWEKLDPAIKAQITRLRDSGAANAADVGAAVVAWLNNASLSNLPPSMVAPVGQTITALTFGAINLLANAAAANSKPYQALLDKVKMTPKSGHVIDTQVQPRMPWHDVQGSVRGPAVFDMAMNFVARWSATAHHYEKSLRDPLADLFLKAFDIKLTTAPKAPRIHAADLPRRAAAGSGKCWVQVLRSAPRTLLTQEATASPQQPRGPAPQAAQNNALKAHLKAIRSAQKFIYIEGQFFQSAYGKDGPAAGRWSGPMGALMDIRRSPGYQRFADMLQIRGVPPQQIPQRMRWAKVDDVLREAGGEEFMSDLKAVLGNVTTVEALRLLGRPQERLKNPIGKALANRIGRAIRDGQPFHVYIVLPVHPEGTLNTLNIMTQVHLTMQSLVHGDHSLVNEIRREILALRWRKEQGMGAQEAKAKAAGMRGEEVAEEVGNEWQQYLTLLNLRNWDTIGGKPVTEQIYVHSKLLIADDRVAILGSANINDRSQWGDRDSELAAIVTDETPHTVSLDGRTQDVVGKQIHLLRKRLWRKLFGLDSKNRAATPLASSAVLDSPAAPATVRLIQGQAKDNAEAYEEAFWFIPRSGARPEVQAKQPNDSSRELPPGSLWPTWRYVDYLNHEAGGKLLYRMPFDELFWREAEYKEVTNTWNVDASSTAGMAPARAPQGILGFITALPVDWTRRENNNSGMNLTVLAGRDDPSSKNGTSIASNQPAEQDDQSMPA